MESTYTPDYSPQKALLKILPDDTGMEDCFMSVTVHTQFDPAVECILFLQRAYSQADGLPGSVEAIRLSLSDKYGIPGPLLTELLMPIQTAEQAFLEGFDPLPEFLSSFFAPGSSSENSLGWAFFFLDRAGVSFDKLEGEELSRQRLRLIALTLNCELSVLSSVTNLHTLSDFLAAYPCTPQTKWVCSRIFCHPAYYQRLYYSQMELVKPLILWVEEPLLSLASATASRISEELEQDSRFIWNQLGMPVSTDDLIVCPTAAGFNGMGLIWDHTASGSPAFLMPGICHHEIGGLIKSYSDNSSFLANRLKSISDTRRLDILKALKNNSMYGQEIADLLSLSPATVSHHMNYLVSDGFVTVDKQGTRVSYSLSKGEIDSFLQNLRGTLL